MLLGAFFAPRLSFDCRLAALPADAEDLGLCEFFLVVGSLSFFFGLGRQRYSILFGLLRCLYFLGLCCLASFVFAFLALLLCFLAGTGIGKVSMKSCLLGWGIPLLPVQRSGGYTPGDAGIRVRLTVAYRDGEERRGAGRIRDPHLGGMASPHGPLPGGGSLPVEPATGLGGKRCPGSRGLRSTGWCVRCCPGSGSGQRSCCGGWRKLNYATSGRAAPTRGAALPFAHLRTPLLEPSL